MGEINESSLMLGKLTSSVEGLMDHQKEMSGKIDRMNSTMAKACSTVETNSIRISKNETNIEKNKKLGGKLIAKIVAGVSALWGGGFSAKAIHEFFQGSQ